MKRLFFAIFVLVLLSACKEEKHFDIAEAKKEILKMHNAQRDYHFNKDSIAFANQFSENFIGVGKGVISSQMREDRITRYHNYFSSVEFVKWDDVTAPVIKFSDDGSLAYTIVDKIVTVTYKDDTGNKVEGTTHYAWTTIYKKYGDAWKIEAVTSTEQTTESN